MPSGTDKITKVLFILTVVSVLSVLSFNLYDFYIKKDYTFQVEASCGVGERCFIRDCSDGECPPNGLEQYRIYTLSANAFDQCLGDSCAALCSNSSLCSEVVCDEDNGDACVVGEGSQ